MSKMARNYYHYYHPLAFQAIDRETTLFVLHIRVYDDAMIALSIAARQIDPPWLHRQITAATKRLLPLAVRLVCLGTEEVLELGRVGELDFAEPSCGAGAGSAGFGQSQRSSGRRDKRR
jgi:hypothetical protein